MSRRPGIALRHVHAGVLAGQSDVEDPGPGPASLATRSDSRTLTYAEVPSWQQDNEYILSGYRRCAEPPMAFAQPLFF